MQRIVHKFSIVYVSSGEKTEVFRSVEEIPQAIRQHIARTARNSRVETLLIANEKGREMLQEQGWNQPSRTKSPTVPPLSPRLRWALLSVLTGIVGLTMIWLAHFR